MNAFQIPLYAFPEYSFPLYSWPLPWIPTEEELLCLCDYAYTRGQVWQVDGECPPGYVASFPRPAEVVEIIVQHPRSDCDAGVWGNGRRTGN